MWSLCDLPWLPPVPTDFRARCGAIDSGETASGEAIQYLAGFRHTAAEALGLSRAVRRSLEAQRDLKPLSPLTLGILAGNTFDLVADYLPAAAARHGVALSIIASPYGQVVQTATDAAAPMNAAHVDAVLVAADHAWLGLARPRLSRGPETVDLALDRLRLVVDALRERGRAAILQTVPTPPESLLGNFDRRAPGSVRAMVVETNDGIVRLAEQTGSYLLDTDALAGRVGTDNWFNPAQSVAYKLAVSSCCNAIYADWIARLLGAIRGKARKCLVLDLDNTIWGGTIGDDGVENLRIGQGTAVGEAHLSLQQTALELRERGILLAVCSRNTDHIARQPFLSHPDMALRMEHFAAFRANWEDKPPNLEAIARELNIGLDALVLIDDNPAERALVRAALPMVAVPELPTDPASFARILQSAGYFETVGLSPEDRSRADSRSAEASRSEARAQLRDFAEYLVSLEMVLTFAPFDAAGRQRIVQLINKTNQFNLTTRRYTEAEISSLERDPGAFTMQVRLQDRFSDLGMIGVVVCRHDTNRAGSWDIDTWLMSCRVLGRRVEEAVLSRLVLELRSRGATQLTGFFIPTPRNDLVREHYGKLGFELVEDTPKLRRFRLSLSEFADRHLPFQIVGGPVASAETAQTVTDDMNATCSSATTLLGPRA